MLRYFSGVMYAAGSFLRIVRLKFLYPGMDIDFKTTIEKNCQIICIKGGQLKIKKSKISYGTSIVVDTGAFIEITQSFIGRNCVIVSKESVVINKNCLIAEMVVIRDQDHIIDNSTDFFIQKFDTAKVILEENVWIASKATVLKGVSVGKYATVAASAVVTKNIPPYEIWGGVPAKFIKCRESV
ncbi:MAG TPA: acyltransferase [Chitinophagaceae bacterium]|nr:acyltransferase [Chitinophagaceae bacterium]